MRELNVVAISTVMTHQKPSGEAFVDLMDGIRQEGTGRLHGGDMGEAQEHVPQDEASIHCVNQRKSLNAIARCINLGLNEMRTLIGSEDSERGDKTFSPDDTAFNSLAFRGSNDDGCDTAFQKDHEGGALPGFSKACRHWVIPQIEVATEQTKVMARQSSQKAVLQVGLLDHDRAPLPKARAMHDLPNTCEPKACLQATLVITIFTQRRVATL